MSLFIFHIHICSAFFNANIYKMHVIDPQCTNYMLYLLPQSISNSIIAKKKNATDWGLNDQLFVIHLIKQQTPI